MGKHHPPKYGGAFEALRFMAAVGKDRPVVGRDHADLMPIRLRVVTASGQVATIGIRRGVVSCHDKAGLAIPWNTLAGAEGTRLRLLLEGAAGPTEAVHMLQLVMPNAKSVDVL